MSAALWLGLTGLSALATYAAVARVLGLHLRPGTLTVLPLAHVVAAYYFQWDMRSVNSNLVMLAAVALGCAALARGREAAAGFWFALAVALKVLPVLLLPYLAWSRRWRALASAAAFSIVFWGAVPLLAFGAGGAAEVYAGWGKELTRATDAGTKLVHPILISLDKATLYAVGGDAAAALAIRLGVCGLWVGLGLLGAAASFGGRARDGFSVLAHASLLVVGPAAVNPYLEPYHLVALAIPAVLLLSAATDPRQSARVRLLALAGFAAGVAVMKVPSPWPLRGLFVNAQSLLLCGTAVFVGWARVRQSPPGETGGAQAPGGRKWGKLLARVRPAMARRG